MTLADQIKSLPSIKDEHGDECVSREAVLGVVAGDDQPFLTAAVTFKKERGFHEGDHKFCCENGRCFLCEESYVKAEARFDAALEAALNP